MNTFQNKTKEEWKALHAAQIGWEFEFYSEHSREETVNQLKKWLGREIILADKYHTDVEISENVFKLEPDFSGGKLMMELVTGALQYNDAKQILIMVLEWIRKNGKTDFRCGIQPNISFNSFKTDLKNSVKDIHALKFVLGFDEEKVYKAFPSRRGSHYAKSIKFIRPITKFSYDTKVDRVDKENYLLPNTKYYGVNFTKLPDDYIEFRYMGGENYEYKTTQILNLVDYFILFMYEMCSLDKTNPYTDKDLKRLKRILEKHNKLADGIRDYESFLLNYNDNIRLTANMRDDEQVIKTYFPNMRERIYELISNADVENIWINYDSDVSSYQIKGGKLTNVFSLQNWELFNVKIDGNFTLCDLYYCELESSFLTDCRLMQSNKVKDSKVIDSLVKVGNVLDNCYLKSDDQTFNGVMNGGIFRSGVVGTLAKISDETEVIDKSTRDASGKVIQK